MILPAGRTGRASADGGRGNHAATQVASECLPKPRLVVPEEHGGTERSQSFKSPFLEEVRLWYLQKEK